MAKTIAKRPARGVDGPREARAARPPEPAGPRARRKATNLTLDPAAVARAEAYRALHGLGSLSQLVNAMLGALPSADASPLGHAALAPAVRRLLGVARPRAGASDAARDAAIDAAEDARTAYHAHLVAKYGATT